jgi:hypothetical protein
MKGTFTRLGALDPARETNNPMQLKPEAVGRFHAYPRIGQMFLFEAEYTKDWDRLAGATIHTTAVTSVKFAEGKHTFTTRNSRYELVETPAITPVTYFKKPVVVRNSGVL